MLAIVVLGTVLASHWTYIQHVRHYPSRPITDVDWYEPKETIPGGTVTEIPAAAQEELKIDGVAISNAVLYAEKKNSASLLIVHRGKVVVESYWQGQTASRWTDSASMAKSVTALLIGIAIAEGKIRSIDQPAEDFLPEWSKDTRRKITIRHLLSMHSGLRPDGEYK